MKENNENQIKLMVGDNHQKDEVTFQNSPDNQRQLSQKLKKPLVYSLMIIACISCFYFIFRPSQNEKELVENGLNGLVPPGTDTGMPLDKGKAYEQEMLAIKNQEKQQALTTLSDYLNQESENSLMNKQNDLQNYQTNDKNYGGEMNNQTLNTYRNMQSELSSFHQPNQTETTELKRQISSLKSQLANQDIPKPITMNDQIELMEKSYQLAAKYLPVNSKQEHNFIPKASEQESKTEVVPKQEKDYIVPIRSAKKNPVSSLFREVEDHSLLIENREFTTVGRTYEAEQSKNTIKACVHETQTIIGDAVVKLRLLESAQTLQHYLPKGTIISANAKLSNGRLMLKINSIEINESILQVELNVYDLDGQLGLSISNSQEISALTEMAANMSQTSGASIMMTQSAGQQLASDLGRGVVQGVSGYFSKKIRMTKVTLKAGLQVLLVAKQ